MRVTLPSVILATVLGALSPLSARSQEHPREEVPARPDSLKAVPDSLIFHFYLPPALGSIEDHPDSIFVFTRPRMQWQDPATLPRLLGTLPGVILQDQVQIGQYTTPTVDGVDWRGMGVLWNGRNFADPASGVYNLELMTQEYLERVEFVAGPRAFLYGLNTTGGAINLVTRNYNSNRPFTRLFHSEASYGYAQTDGSFAQNISRHVNVTTGFHYQGTDGRYPNESDGSWQIRGKIRYAVTPNVALLFSEYFTSTNTNLSGGVDRSTFSFGAIPTGVDVVNADSYEKITRHDVDVTAVGTLLPDSTDVTTLTGYYSANLREYREQHRGLFGSGVYLAQDQRSSWSGVQLTQTLSSPLGSWLAGAMLERRQVEGSPTIGRRSTILSAAWLKDELPIAGAIDLAAYGRVQRILGHSTFGIGADARLAVAGGVAAFGGLSVSHRVPNFTELYWSDSTAIGNPGLLNERHAVAEAGLEWWKDEENFARLAIDFRTIVHPILVERLDTASVFPPLHFTTGSQVKIADLSFLLSSHFWKILIEANGTYFLSRSGGTEAEDLPRLRVSGGVYYRGKLFKDELDLKAGFRGWYRTGYNGDVFNPQVLAFVPNPGLPLGQAASVDFVLLAHLGDAQIHFIWENLPGISYFASPGYPGLDRVLRFGLSWDFWN